MRFFYVVGSIRNKSVRGDSATWFKSEKFPTALKCKANLVNGDKSFGSEDVVITNIIELSAEDYKSFVSEQ